MNDGNTAPLIEVTDVVKRFGKVVAVNGVSLKIDQGDAVVIFGPNGAGKTTLFRILAGLIRPDEGSLSVEGADVTYEYGETIRHRIGYISHQSMTYTQLSARENLLFFARLYGVADPDEKADALLKRVGLTSRADDITATFSRGMKQRLSIARALVHDPDIILLDEPFTGLDQHAAEILKDTLSHLHDERKTFIMVTHNIRVGLAISRRVVVQVAGKIAMTCDTDGLNPDEFTERYFTIVGGKHY